VPVIFGTAAVDCAGRRWFLEADGFRKWIVLGRDAALVAGSRFAGARGAAAGLAVAVEGLAARAGGDF